MTREERSVTLAILTLFVYAGWQYFEKAAILFPFPLNEVVFLVIVVQFSIWNWKKHQIQLIFALLAGIFHLISTQFFWSFFMNFASMEKLVNGISLDIFALIYYFLMLVWMSIFFLKSTLPYKYALTIAAITLTISALILPNGFLETLIWISIAIIGVVGKLHSPIYLLWVLIAALQIMKMLTIFLP